MTHIRSLLSLTKNGPKLWPLECSQGFSMIWPSDLFFFTWHDPYLNLTEILSRWSFWPSLMKIGPKLWSLKCSQGFSMIWPTDLVLAQHDPYSILTKFDEDWTKTMVSKVFTRFFYDLTYWPNFWPNMIHIRSWPSLMKIGPKLWPLECSQGFFYDLTTDQVFDLG